MNIFSENNILYQDEWLVAVNKPYGLPVHQNEFLPKDALYLNKLLGQVIGKSVYNVHRLDAKTSGVMVLALSAEIAHQLTLLFERKEVLKTYLAIVKGLPGNGVFNEKVVVKKKSKFKKHAITAYSTAASCKTGMTTKEGETLYLSKVILLPETGRWHQLRQHLAKNRTDIIGDTHHGDFTLNKQIKEITGIQRLMLHAQQIKLKHPATGEELVFETEAPKEFDQLMEMLSQKSGNISPEGES